MAPRRVVLALVAVLALTGCGGSDNEAPQAAAAGTPIAEPERTAIPAAPPLKPGKGEKQVGAAAAAGGVAPEKVAPPSTTDAVSSQGLAGWQGLVVQELRKVDPRLVASDAVALKKVRATCEYMETGAFETKVVPLIVKRFSTAKFTPSYDLGQTVYSILLQYACYRMNETPNT